METENSEIIATKQEAVGAVSRITYLLYQASLIRSAVANIRYMHDEGCEEMDGEIEVLHQVAAEKCEETFHAATCVETYFPQEARREAIAAPAVDPADPEPEPEGGAAYG
jgi:hypothetical protein